MSFPSSGQFSKCPHSNGLKQRQEFFLKLVTFSSDCTASYFRRRQCSVTAHKTASLTNLDMYQLRTWSILLRYYFVSITGVDIMCPYINCQYQCCEKNNCICSPMNDASDAPILQNQVTGWRWITNWKVYWMKWSWLNYNYYIVNYLDAKKKITIKLRRVGVPVGIRYKHALNMSATLVLQSS